MNYSGIPHLPMSPSNKNPTTLKKTQREQTGIINICGQFIYLLAVSEGVAMSYNLTQQLIHE